MIDWDPMTDLERDALQLIETNLGWEPKSARGFIAGFLWKAQIDAKAVASLYMRDIPVPTAMDIADAFHEWFYNLSEGSMKFYREDFNAGLDLTRKEN